MANIVKHMRTKAYKSIGLQPSSSLSTEAQVVFRHITSNLDESHFSEADRPLLDAYANSAALAAQAAQHLDSEGAVGVEGKVNPWLVVSEKAGKQLVALSARLRICPQSRYDRLVAGSNGRSQIGGTKSYTDDDMDPLLA